MSSPSPSRVVSALPSLTNAESPEAEDACPLVRIGIVEDNDDLRDSLVEFLAARGHVTVGFPSAEDLNDSGDIDALDLVLADLNLPGEDGLALVGRLKRAYPRMRVIMMTSRTAVRDRVRGYDAGADIYLPKPVHEDEILAAVRALTRNRPADGGDALDASPQTLHVNTRALSLSGPVHTTTLSIGECALLAALARAPSHRLEFWTLMSVLGLDLDASGGRATLAVRMTRLRNKLVEVGADPEAVKSLRGFGYQLCVAVEVS